MKIVNIKSRLKLITGLHIGSSDDSMKIGGVDSPVISREVLSDDDGNIVLILNIKLWSHISLEVV